MLHDGFITWCFYYRTSQALSHLMIKLTNQRINNSAYFTSGLSERINDHITMADTDNAEQT